MDDVDDPPITEDEVAFLLLAYSVIKQRGENVYAFTEDELFQVQVMFASAINLKREDLIQAAGISQKFVFEVEERSESLGTEFA